MPYYDLRCEDCQTESNIKASVQQRVSGELQCPSCGSGKLQTIYKKVNILRYHGKDCDGCSPGEWSPAGGCCGGSCSQGSLR